jgi:PhoPQ-activated pathogenicity-related protein
MRTLAFCVLALSVLGVPSLSAAGTSTPMGTALDRYVDPAGDQYFLPDSSQFYFAGLKGETYLRYVRNRRKRM